MSETRNTGWAGGSFDEGAHAGLQEEVKLKQRLGGESMSCPHIWGMAFQAEGTAEAKAWHV